jgi:tetratricopeptide (TPR) repeat protein
MGSAQGFLIGLFAELSARRFTGQFQLSTQKTLRRIFFVEGGPVGFWSDHPEDTFGRRFVNAGHLDSKALRWAEQHLSNGERIEEVLVEGSTVSWEQVAVQQVRHIESGLDTVVRMKTGDWELKARPELAQRLMISAMPKANLYAALWKGVRKSVSADAAVQALAGRSGAFRCEKSLAAICSEIEMLPEGLEQGFRDGKTLEQIFEKLRDPAGELFQLVWFLECTGAVSRADAADSKQIYEEPDVPQSHEVHRPNTAAPVEGEAISLGKGQDVPLSDWQDKEVPDNRGMSMGRADELMKIGAYAAALSFLEEARFMEPNNPDVLAVLGWAHFQATGGEEFDEAEGFIDLALSFDERHIKALEYRGRLALEKGEVDRARIMVERLAEADPKNRWAKAQMRQLGANQGSKRGFAFWRRK